MNRWDLAKEIAEKMIEHFNVNKDVKVLTEEIYEIINKHVENY